MNYYYRLKNESHIYVASFIPDLRETNIQVENMAICFFFYVGH